jgi:hypothetical protein
MLWNQLEIMVGDSKQQYGNPRVDSSGALIVPLCPDRIFDDHSQEWRDTDQVKVYHIEEEVVNSIWEG